MCTWAIWVPYILGAAREMVVALDWTDFDADGHSTIAAYLVTGHGRATPLVWMSVKKARLKGRRNVYEDTVLLRLHEVLRARDEGHGLGGPGVWRSEAV